MCDASDGVHAGHTCGNESGGFVPQVFFCQGTGGMASCPTAMAYDHVASAIRPFCRLGTMLFPKTMYDNHRQIKARLQIQRQIPAAGMSAAGICLFQIYAQGMAGGDRLCHVVTDVSAGGVSQRRRRVLSVCRSRRATCLCMD